MAGNKMICHCKQVSYIDIRMAMVKGARTLDEIKEMTGAATACGRCAGEIEKILKMTWFASDEAFARFSKKLRRLGIDDKLKEKKIVVSTNVIYTIIGLTVLAIVIILTIVIIVKNQII